ncbi:hypothetical protein [Blastopirellula retiformator]|nr:hypothetical protein [Blastopirellula retiformator]
MSMQTGTAVAADLDAEGVFAAEKRLPPGHYVAFLVPKTYDEAAPEAPTGRSRATKSKDSAGASVVPRKYWDEGTSPWRVDVVAGLNDIQLQADR